MYVCTYVYTTGALGLCNGSYSHDYFTPRLTMEPPEEEDEEEDDDDDDTAARIDINAEVCALRSRSPAASCSLIASAWIRMKKNR